MLYFNAWVILDAWISVDNGDQRKRRYYRARCRRCQFEVSERADHFIARTHCPNCEDKP